MSVFSTLRVKKTVHEGGGDFRISCFGSITDKSPQVYLFKTAAEHAHSAVLNMKLSITLIVSNYCGPF